MPDIIGVFTDKKNLPEFIGDTDWGHRFWGAIFSVINLYFPNVIVVHSSITNEYSSPGQYP